MTSNSRASMVMYVKLKNNKVSRSNYLKQAQLPGSFSKTIERAKRNWNTIKSLCNRKWSLAVPTLVLLNKTTILPSLFYAAPIWLEKNLKYVTAVQNNFIRTVFRHEFLPNIDSCQVLLGTPTLDLLSTAINVKFLLKLKLEDDLLQCTHDAPSSFPVSFAYLLESHVTSSGKFLIIHNCTRYKQQDVNLLIKCLRKLRCKNSDQKSFLKCYTKTPPTWNTISLCRPFSTFKGNRPSKFVKC